MVRLYSSRKSSATQSYNVCDVLVLTLVRLYSSRKAALPSPTSVNDVSVLTRVRLYSSRKSSATQSYKCMQCFQRLPFSLVEFMYLVLYSSHKPGGVIVGDSGLCRCVPFPMCDVNCSSAITSHCLLGLPFSVRILQQPQEQRYYTQSFQYSGGLCEVFVFTYLGKTTTGNR